MAQSQARPAKGIDKVDPVWARIRKEAEDAARREPEFATFLYENVLHHDTLEAAIIHRVSERLGNTDISGDLIRQGYTDALDSDVAEIKNDPDAWAQAGSVTAALFLQRFAPAGPWAHLDIFAWNPRNRPGHPAGAEAQAIRGLYRMIRDRFA